MSVGYVELRLRRRLNTMSQLLSRAHWTVSRNRTASRDYCMKEDTRMEDPVEHGEWTAQQGKRNDIVRARDMLKEGKSKAAIYDEIPAMIFRYSKGLNEASMLTPPPPRTRPMKTVIYFGPPGTGKTRKAKRKGLAETWIAPIGSSRWFDGYDGQPIAVLDDFAGSSSHVRLDELLRVADPWCTERVPVKGSHVWWQPYKLYITTNIHPRDWYDYGDRVVQYRALQRRIHKVVLFDEQDETTVVPVGTFFIAALANGALCLNQPDVVEHVTVVNSQ